MRPSEISIAMQACIAAKRPGMLWGAPGVGKSQVTAQLAKNLNMVLLDVRAILFDPVDLRGIPHIDKDENGINRTTWAIPDFLPNEERHGKTGILFIDEINAAPPSVQAAFYQLMLDRKLGDYELPEGWYIFAAGNREKDRAVVNKMPTALSNRLIHIDFDIHTDDWVEWAISSNLAPEIISFIKFKSDLLHDFDTSQRAFPTPRTWEFASDMLPHVNSSNELDLLAGTVGEGAAGEFIAFLRVWRDLPSVESIIANPTGIAVSKDPSILYAITGSLAHKSTEETFEPIIKYVERIDVEYQVLFMREIAMRDANLKSNKHFIRWASANTDVML